MDFSFSEEQILLRDSVRKLMERVATPEYVAQAGPRARLSCMNCSRPGPRPVFSVFHSRKILAARAAACSTLRWCRRRSARTSADSRHGLCRCGCSAG